MSELDRMRRDGPSMDDVQKVKETEKESLETSYKQNGFWLGALQTAQMLGWDPVSIIHRTDRPASELLLKLHAQLGGGRNGVGINRWHAAAAAGRQA